MVRRKDCVLWGKCRCSCPACRKAPAVKHCGKHETECHVLCRNLKGGE